MMVLFFWVAKFLFIAFFLAGVLTLTAFIFSVMARLFGFRLRRLVLRSWAEPLDNGIQRVLMLNLTGLLNTQDVSIFPWRPERAPDFGVEVNLLQLDANETAAMLTADWLVYRPGGNAPINRRISRLRHRSV